MLSWVAGLGYKADSTPDAPTVPTVAPSNRVQKTSPNAWETRWRTVGWLRLLPRPAWVASPC